MTTRILRPLLLVSAVLAPGVALAQINPVQSGTPAFQTLQVGPTTPINGFGTAIGQALGPMVNYQGSGLPGLLLSSRLIFARQTTHANDFTDFQISRTTSFTGGTFANINSALTVKTTVGANDSSQEWNFLASITDSGAASGLGVGAYLQAVRPGALSTPPATPGNDPLWATIIDVNDFSGLSSSAGGGALVPLEIDLVAMDVDDATNGGSFGNRGVRKILQVVAKQAAPDSLTPTEFTNGLWFSQGTPTHDSTHIYYDSAIGFSTLAQARIALDTRGVTAPTGSTDPVAAVTMTAGQIIDLKGSASMTSNPGGAYLQYRTATNRLYYVVGGVDMWSVDASGNVRAKGTVTGSTTP